MTAPSCRADGKLNAAPPPEWHARELVIARCLVTRTGDVRECYVSGREEEATLRHMQEWLHSQHCKPITRGGQALDVCYLFSFRPEP